jgi:hypothetical protein
MRRFAILAAGLGLLLTAGPSAAQTPAAPPAPDVEKRLRALEEKMDRVLQLLEARESAPRPAERESAAALQATRDKLQAELDAKIEQYHDFQLKNPYVLFRGPQGVTNIYAERLAKIEQRRADIKLKKAETTDRLAKIEQVHKAQGKAAAMAMITATGIRLQQFEAGNDSTKEQAEKLLVELKQRRQALLKLHGQNHPAIKENDDTIALTEQVCAKLAAAKDREAGTVESFLAAMRAEIGDADTLLQTLDNLFDQEAKLARDMSNYEARDKQFRTGIDRLRQMLDQLDKRLRELPGREPAK